MFNRIILFFFFLLFLTNCSNENLENKDSLFSKLDASETGINFQNEVKNGENMNIFKYRNFYNGGGVAIGDINNDGLVDLVLGNEGKNSFYKAKTDQPVVLLAKDFECWRGRVILK